VAFVALPASISSKNADSFDMGCCADLAVLKLPVGDIKLDMAERTRMVQCMPMQFRGSGIKSCTDNCQFYFICMCPGHRFWSGAQCCDDRCRTEPGAHR
jgi:hypothetical protein